MSTTIDEKVVEMRFDNAQFERNVSQSMSTLDKLKAKLNFKDSSKGLQEIQDISSKMDFSTLNGSIQAVGKSFSAMEVIGITALANITNSAVNAGKQLVKSLSVDQIMSGWHKGEEKIASIQTLVNSTGKSLDEIDSYLDQLMWYSDETSYSFTEMVSSLASMTSTGGDIERLIPTIMGIANATAYAGKGANEFSRVIYNLQQSYGQGYLSAIDWKSVQQAGVASEALVKVLIEEGKKAGTIAQDMNMSVGDFAGSLKDKWVTQEVLENSFGRLAEFSMAVKKLVDESEGTLSAAKAIDILRDSYDELTVKMFTSAQEAKSFSEAINATKDAVSSGWMTTFEKIFGSYEETKSFWTEVTNSLWDIFASGAEARNQALDDIMTNNGALKTLKKTLEATGHTMGDFEEELLKLGPRKQRDELKALIEEYGSLEMVINKVGYPVEYLTRAFNKLTGSEGEIATVAGEATASLEEMQALVNAVIRGDFGNGQDRVNRLTEAGHSYVAVQTLVNKVWERNGRTWNNTTITAEDLAEAIALMTDEERKNIGLTEDQIATVDDLIASMSEGKMSAEEMWEALSKPTGRALLTGSFTNVLEAISTFITVIKTAWHDIFGDLDTGAIYNTIEAINKFTDALILKGVKEDENGDVELTGQAKRFADILHIVFGAVKLVTDVIKGAFKVAWTVATTVIKSVVDIFKTFYDILLGGMDGIDGFIINSEDIAAIFDKIRSVLSTVITYVSNLIKSFLEWEPVSFVISKIRDFLIDIKGTISNLTDPATTTGKTIAKIWGTVQSVFDNIKSVFASLPKLFPKVASKAKSAGKAIESPLTVIIDIFSKIVSAISKVVEYATGLVKMFLGWEPVQALMSTVYNIFVKIKDILGGLFDPITDENGNEVGATFKNVAERLSTVIGNIVGAITENAPIIANAIWEIGKNIVLGLIQGIKDNAGTIWDFVSGLFNGFIEFIKGIFGIHSPSIVMIGIGGMLIAGLVAGFAGGWDNIWNAIKELGKKLIENIGSVINWVKDFIVTGLKGIKDAIGEVIEWTKENLPGLANFFSDLTFGKAIGAGLGIGGLVEMIRMGDTMRNFSYVFEAIADIGNTFRKTMKKFNFLLLAKGIKTIAEAILMLAISMAIVVGSLWALSMIPYNSLEKSISVLMRIFQAVLVTALVLMAVGRKLGASSLAISKENGLSSTGSGKGIFKILLGIAIAVLAFAIALKIVSKIDEKDLTRSLNVLIVLMTIMVIAVGTLMLLAKDIPGESKVFKQIGNTMIKLAVALLLMVLVCKLIGKLKANEIVGGIVAMGLMLAFMLALNKVSQTMHHDPSIGLLKVVIAIGLLALVFKLIGTLDGKTIAKGIGFLAIFLVFVFLLGAITKNSFNMTGLAGILMGMGVCLLLMAASIKILSTISVGKAIVGVLALIVLMTALTIMVRTIAEGISGGEIPKLIGTMVALSIFLLTMTICVMILTIPSAGDLAKAVIAVAALTAMIAGLLYMIVLILAASPNSKGVVGVIVALTIAIVAMTACVMIINLLTPEQITTATITLGILMGMFAVMLAAVAAIVKFSGSSLTGVIIIIGVLIAFVAVIAVLIMCLSQAVQDPEKLKLMALALLAVLGTLALVMVAAAAIGPEASFAIIGLGVMIIALAAFWACALLIKQINPEGLLPPIQALETLVTSMLPIMATLALFAVLAPLAAVGIVAMDVALVLLIGTIATLASIVAAIDAALGQGATLETINYLGEVLHAIGEAIGKGISGLALGITNDLETIGQRIHNFLDEITPGLEKVKGFGDDFRKGAGNLFDFFVLLAGSKIANGIGNFFGTNTDDLKTQMIAFGEGIAGFYNALDGISLDTVTAATSIGRELVDTLNAINANSGLFAIFSVVDMAAFAADAVLFGGAVSGYVTALAPAMALGLVALVGATIIDGIAASMVKTLNELQGYRSKKTAIEKFSEDMLILVPAMADVMDALKWKAAVLTSTIGTKALTSLTETLVELEKGLPRRGGIIDAWFGKDDLGSFGGRLRQFAAGICLFADTIAQKGANLNSDLVNKAIRAAETLGGIESNLPENKSMVVSWFGKDIGVFNSTGGDIGAFGTRLSSLANGICAFADKIAERGGNLNNDVLPKAINIAKILSGLENNLPDKTTGISTWWKKTEDGDFITFGENLSALSRALATMATDLEGIRPYDISKFFPTITSLIDKLTRICSLAGQNGYKNMGTVMEGIGQLGEQLRQFSNNVNGISDDEMTTALGSLTTISDYLSGMSIGDTRAFSFMASGMEKLANSGLDSFVSALDNTDNINKLVDEANKIVTKFVEELGSDVMLDRVESIGTEHSDMYIDTVGSQYQIGRAQDKGSELAQGYILGVSNPAKYKLSYNAGWNLADNTIRGIGNRQQSKSPSKVGIKYGNYLGQGFIIGIDAYGRNAYDAGSELGASALNSLNNAITSAKDMLENNIDSQPTIRPVLDLSDIQSGAGRIGAMLNASPMIFGSSSMARSISGNFIGQNGRNYDVVSALDRLGSDIVNNTSGDSYVINGVTYEEGSDVAEAIQTLAHAAVVHGRR